MAAALVAAKVAVPVVQVAVRVVAAPSVVAVPQLTVVGLVVERTAQEELAEVARSAELAEPLAERQAEQRVVQQAV